VVHSTSPAAAANITSQLQAERTALQAFVALLESEQQALIAGQTEQLLPLADSKTLAVQELNKLANARNNMLLASGAKSGAGGIETWLQAHAAGSLPVWRDIQKLALQSQQTNSSNGKLIQLKLWHNQQALAVLHKAANSAGSLYGPDGQPHISATGRTLGSG
jgi:flagellar biosynthesis protein FlgN